MKIISGSLAQRDHSDVLELHALEQSQITSNLTISHRVEH